VASTPIVLPTTPNSLVFDNLGTNAYLGVNSGDFRQQGLMVFTGTSVNKVTQAPGKVLAISPDRNTVIISDTADSPNLLFICASCSSTSRTVTTLQITAATAAAFSPDSLKAYILATPPPPAQPTLYIYSKLDPLQSIPLAGTANDVAFHPEGGFAYLAGPATSISPYRTCDNSPLSSATLTTSNPPLMIRPLPDGTSLLVLDPPNIDIVSVTSLTAVGCTGTVTNTANSFNLGQGAFIPTQFFVSPDGSTAYILADAAAGGRLPFIMVFNVATQTSSVLSLSNSATPLSASLAPDGTLLFVGADDGTLHVINTASGSDTQQVTFPFPTNELCFGPGNPATQVPLTQVSISAVSQSGSTSAYTYSVISGPGLKAGQSITIADLASGADNGTFTVTGFGTDGAGKPTFIVTNSLGVTASNQSGLGTVPISCNPDLVAVKP
jgi:WD40 repeat protein